MLQGINSQSDMYSAYNRIQFNRALEDSASTKLSGQNQSQEVAASSKEVAPKEMDLRLDSIKPRVNASLEDISLSLNESSASFEMKGRESDIAQLDMEKAVSDMQKDKALMQYQYFVGDSNPFMSSEDGIVIAKTR